MIMNEERKWQTIKTVESILRKINRNKKKQKEREKRKSYNKNDRKWETMRAGGIKCQEAKWEKRIE